MSYEIQGKVIEIQELQTYSTGFQKRVLVLEKACNGKDGQVYRDMIPFEFVKNNVSKLDDVNVGDEIEVGFNLRGNEYKGKYFSSVQGWKIRNLNAPQVAVNNNISAVNPPVFESKEGEDVPF